MPTRRSRIVLALAALCLVALVLVPREVPASVEEQRRRLPPPATCKDPVEGIWLGHKYFGILGEWYYVTLEIHREAPDSNRLKGNMHVRFWDAGPQDEKPPPCRPGVRDRTIDQPSKGTYDSGKVRFDALSWHRVPGACDQYAYGFAYNPDHYSGTIDPAIQEFQSVNNDGGAAVNDPMVFRRIKCFDVPDAPSAAPIFTAKPPELTPPSRSVGCGKLFGK